MRTIHPVRTRLTGALAALVLGGALTACGGADDSQATDQPATADSTAASEATASPSADPTSSDSPATLDDGAEVPVADFVARIKRGIEATDYAHLEFGTTGSGGGLSGRGDIDYTGATPEMDMSMDVSGQQMTVLLVDKVMYLQTSQSGKKYLEYDLTDPDNPLGSRLTDNLDPSGSIAALADAVTEVRSLGRESVDGTSLDHYVMSVDSGKLASQAAQAGLPAQLDIDVWLDSEDRMAQTRMDFGTSAYEAHLSDFDTPVTVEAPPANQVVGQPTS